MGFGVIWAHVGQEKIFVSNPAGSLASCLSFLCFSLFTCQMRGKMPARAQRGKKDLYVLKDIETNPTKVQKHRM